MTKKPRENRVPIMMSEEELAAIDDWRFANKVATRSEAVRRLCQIGLGAHRFASLYGMNTWELANTVHERLKTAEEKDLDLLAEIFSTLVDVTYHSGRAMRYAGKEGLSDLLANDARLRRLAEEEDADEEDEQ